MSQPGPPRRRARSVRQIISGTRHLLLDFDGPICSIYAETPDAVVAEQLRGILRAAGVSFPAEVAAQPDPLEVFGYAAGLSPQTAELAQRELTKLETQAAATAKPTEGAADLIATAAATGRTVIIVSNNSSYAILEYLAIHRIGPVAGVVGRDESDPALMKPSPYLVRAAVGILDAHPDDCAFVGDSTTDMLAGRLAGVPVIGYANKPGKAELLTQAGADTVTTDLDEITTALRLTPRPVV
jgi:phosphoglycolate phosphatase-like HAD superfamily hydrolase